MELVTTASDDGITRVALVGRLDVKGLQAVDLPFHAATAAKGRPTVVDCSKLEFVASLGMGMLFACAHSLRSKGARMAMYGTPVEVAEALRTAGLDQVIVLVDDEDAAVAAVG